ncbi:MAG: cupin domain-containing protein [Phycicoccus sp.]
MTVSMPWEHEDPLTQALYSVRMRGAFYSWTEARGEGSLAMPQFDDTLTFHVVARGSVFIEVDGAGGAGGPAGSGGSVGPPGSGGSVGGRASSMRDKPPTADGVSRSATVRLDAGHLALVPRGIGHRVSTSPGARVLGRADELPQTMLGDAFSLMTFGGPDDPELVAMLCGVVAFDSPAVHDLLAVLPPIIRVDSARHPVMASLVPLLAEELRVPRPGGDAVATRLADVLVIETVRAWLADEPESAEGWLAALRDPRLGPALAAVHRDPGHPWTLAALAGVAAMSRSSFTARFTSVVGVPPMTYVAAARMRRAREMLVGGSSVAAVASALGYGSEAAFSRAFLRVMGMTPGRARRSAA